MRFLERFNSKKKYIENVDKVDIVLFGDSWLDYWTDEKFIENDRTFFDDIVKFNLDAINVGVGGTEFSDWLPLLDEFVIKLNPNKVFICLGGNDTYNGKSVEEVFIDFKKTIRIFSGVRTIVGDDFVIEKSKKKQVKSILMLYFNPVCQNIIISIHNCY